MCLYEQQPSGAIGSHWESFDASFLDSISGYFSEVSAKTQITPTPPNDSQWLPMDADGSCSYKHTLFVAPNGFRWLPMTPTA